MNKQALYERIRTMLLHIESKIVVNGSVVTDLLYRETEYKVGSQCPRMDESNAAIFRENDVWGGALDQHAWFYKHISLPQKSSPDNRLELTVQTNRSGWDASNPQFIVYFNGVPQQGMDLNHTSVVLPDVPELDVHIYAYTGTVDGTDALGLHPKAEKPVELHVQCVEIDEWAERLYYDLIVPADVLRFSDSNTHTYAAIMEHLNNALNLLQWHSEDALRQSLPVACAYMQDEFYNKFCQQGDIQVSAIGHTHIDIGWLWTVRQTREKAQRSFFTVLKLMEQYPEYKFMSSQVPLYKAIKEECPEKYEEIKKRIAEGRWEVEGAMYVEADCNLTSGESLVRQVLYGKKFFKEEFGVDSKVLWLPDVFGYSAALPQILRKSGVDKFVTSKISWNDTNMMPHDTFNWKGIDGTEIFTHFMTSQEIREDGTVANFTTYLPQANASYVMGSWKRYLDKDIAKDALLTFGYGDGGGGPTARDLQMLRRMNYGIPNCPTTKIETATEFLNRMQAKTEGKRSKWVGELYFEYHRGTYTSQAKIKKNNRKAEFALQNCEAVSVMAEKLLGIQYPAKELAKMWEKVLTNQFHDILPGSSIQQVYDDANADYEYVLQQCKKLMQDRLAAIAAAACRENGVFVMNNTPFATGGVVKLDGVSRYVESVPARGYAIVQPVKCNNSVQVSDSFMENDFFQLEFDDRMYISRFYDKRNGREVLPAGKTAGELIAYEDFPSNFDAWELSLTYREKSYLLDTYESVDIVRDAERSGVRIVRKFADSTIEQTIWLYEHMDQLDIDTKLDWHTEHITLKSYFPVDVNTQKATCDIQFGNCERPVHTNTSWDTARFEVCAQKFVDLSDSGYGLAVINDCKYGHSFREQEIGITMLRCPIFPDPDCDKGLHEFTYTLYPHADDVRHSEVYQKAYLMNNPLVAVMPTKTDCKLPSQFSIATATAENVVIDTIKQTEDGKGTIIRLYECQNRSANVNLTIGFDCAKVSICNLMEEPERALTVENHSVLLHLKPFEVVTVRIEN